MFWFWYQTSPQYAPEVRERVVRIVFKHEGEHAPQWAVIGSITAKTGCTAETLEPGRHRHGALHGGPAVRLMGLKGAIRGKAVRTMVGDRAAPRPADRVNRQFQALRPNALCVADFTCVATWQGLVSSAFAIVTFARRIVGRRVSRTARSAKWRAERTAWGRS